MQEKGFSIKAYWFLVLVCVTVFGISHYWSTKPVIEWDVTLYYSYLPAIFIYHDLKLDNMPSDQWSNRHFYMNQDRSKNKYVKVTAGLSFLYAPFFAGAHIFASLHDGFASDGFSIPYRFALLLSALFFSLWGIYLLRLVLLRFFSELVTGFTVLIIFSGTNLPYYIFVEPMSHAYNFFLISLMCWSFFNFLDNRKAHLALLFGFSAGLVTLIRPTDVIVLFFPITYIILKKPLPWRVLWPNLFLALLTAVAVISPQLIYWKYMTGKWVVYSYNDESFFFLDPEILKGFFSYRKGWFTYSPVLFFTLPGFVILGIIETKLFISIFSTLALFSWVTFSWWCWWYGGGFGARPMIDVLPLMALPLAATLHHLIRQKIWVRAPAFALIAFLCIWSVFMNKQYETHILHWDSMSKELFWAHFFKDHRVDNYQAFEDPPNYEAARRNIDIN